MTLENDMLSSWMTETPEETEELGSELVSRMDGAWTLGLVGPLGAGKTTLVKGIIEALGGDPGSVRSPTYTLINRYDDVSNPVVHADLYRADSEAEQETIGLESFFESELLLVEWADRWVSGWPENTSTILLEHEGPSERSLKLLRTDPTKVVQKEDSLLHHTGE